MKGFITGAAMLLLLMVFPLQTALEMANEVRMTVFSDIVHLSVQRARVDGYFKSSTITELKQSLLNAFPDLSEGEIYINVTTAPKYRLDVFDVREAIFYDIRIPVRGIIAVPQLFGIEADRNRYISRRSGMVLSELPMP